MNKVVPTKKNRNAPLPNKEGGGPSDNKLLAPYKSMATYNRLTHIHQKRLLKFLRFAHVHGIETPSKQDFLEFSWNRKPPDMLKRLREVFEVLFPGHPMIVFVLNEAILEKTRTYYAKYRSPRMKKSKKAKISADVRDWPQNWQDVWHQLKNCNRPSGVKVFGLSTLENMREVLGRYVWALSNAGLPIEINVENLRAYEQAIIARAPADEDAAYKNEGKRVETFRTATRRLIQFGTELGVDPAVLDGFRKHERFLEVEAENEEPLKYGRLENVPDYRAIYKLAFGLLRDSFKANHIKTRTKLRNQAAIIALWMFIPLRLSDGLLRWGADIEFRNGRYSLNVATNKTGKRILARLHPKLNLFFDALVFQEVSHNLGPAWLEHQRQKLIEEQAPVFHDHLGNMYAKKRPSKVWREHFGTGAHIARTKAHTELGKKGEEGVSMALALCAQKDFKTRLHYQAEAVGAALTSTSQDMMDSLIEEALTSGDNGEVNSAR